EGADQERPDQRSGRARSVQASVGIRGGVAVQHHLPVLREGGDVKIVGFGHFRIRQKLSRRGRNPQTGDSIEITARKVLTFKPSKGLKQRINGGVATEDTEE